MGTSPWPYSQGFCARATVGWVGMGMRMEWGWGASGAQSAVQRHERLVAGVQRQGLGRREGGVQPGGHRAHGVGGATRAHGVDGSLVALGMGYLCTSIYHPQ